MRPWHPLAGCLLWHFAIVWIQADRRSVGAGNEGGPMMKKHVMIFGDSNTWGWKPSNDLISPPQRWDDEVRWPGVMQEALGSDYRVIQEGLNGRTTVWDDPIEEYRCGKAQLIPTLDIHAPLDLVIIMVGSNDLKARFGVLAEDVANGAGLLVEKTLSRADDFVGGKPKVLLICPPPLGPIEKAHFKHMFHGGVEKSKRLSAFFEAKAKQYGVAFFDAGTVIHSSEEDGLHLQADQHAILGKEVAGIVRQLIGS